ncbi:MAG: macro domain-containing protein [Bacteroidota bacterium]
MKFYFVDINRNLTEAWEKSFKDIENVIVKHDSIFNYPCDAIVSPANSFGFMDGGIDLPISEKLGWHVQKNLQKIIIDKYYGELLVGQSEILETGHKDFPYLISAPTMRIPKPIDDTTNVYLAFKAILSLLKFGKFDNGELIRSKVQSVAIPGLGTGVGQLHPINCARQMRAAWEEIMNERFKIEKDWGDLDEIHTIKEKP